MNLTPEQLRLIYNSVRRYQFDKTAIDSNEYWECSEVLDKLFDQVYTQRQEQPT